VTNDVGEPYAENRTYGSKSYAANPRAGFAVVCGKEISSGLFAGRAGELAEEFLVVANLGRDGFESVTELVDLDGQSGEGESVLAVPAVFVDDGVQLRSAIQGGPAGAGSGADGVERDFLASGNEVYAGLFDAGGAVVAHPAAALADIQKLVDDWTTAHLAASTVTRQYSCVRAVFSWAMSADIIHRSPCRGIELPQAARPKRRRLRVIHLERLAQELDPDQATMMWTGVASGLRWAEVAGRQVKDFDLSACRLTVTKQLDRKPNLVEPKTAAGGRTFAIPRWLAEEVQAHLARRGLTADDGEALVFVGVKGGPLNYSAWRRAMWAPACARAALSGLGFHDLRRMNATQLVAVGADPKVAQTRLGHADPRLTLRLYAEVTEEADRAAADAVGSRLRPGRVHRTTEELPDFD
jgi:integrase